jgi:phosphoribosyl-ATP pyrophosphohydrolase
VIHHKRLGTVISDLGIYDVVNKNSWIDVLFDGEEHICQIRKDFLKKLDDEKILTENKFHNLALYKNITIVEMMIKLSEECFEVEMAIKNNDMKNLEEELLDVMQVIKGIAYVKGIDLDTGIEKHNNKLRSRGHEFID